MKISGVCLDAIKGFEGFQRNSYRCPAGVWTIGYGHTKGVKPGQVVTEKQAEVLLEGDLLPCERFVDSLGLNLLQYQFDALVDFSFNLGVEALRKSTLLERIRFGAPKDTVQREFMRWVYAGGKMLSGLQRRRMWEARHFFGEV